MSVQMAAVASDSGSTGGETASVSSGEGGEGTKDWCAEWFGGRTRRRVDIWIAAAHLRARGRFAGVRVRSFSLEKRNRGITKGAFVTAAPAAE